MALAGEFRRQVVAKGIFGFDEERYRKICRSLQRHPDVVAEGFAAVTHNARVRGRGGADIGGIEVAFVVLASLEQAPLNEELAARCWHIYSAPCQTIAPNINAATFRKTAGKLRCPVTGEQWGGRALRNVLADPALAARVDFLMLDRHIPELTITWKSGPSSTFFHKPDQDAWLQSEAPGVQSFMRGKTLAWLSEVTQPSQNLVEED